MKKDIKSVLSISVCILFVITGFTSPVIADDDTDTDRDWLNLSLLQGTVSEFDNMQPFTTLNYIIALQGIFPSRALSSLKIQGGVGVVSAEPYIGEIVLFAGNFAPRGWAFCDGQLLQISQNTALFSLLGTTYGGDGRSTFGLPDLRGRVPMHAGTGPGLTNRRLGQTGGSETGQCEGTCTTPPTISEFDNMLPYLALNYIIALQGIFPSRALSSLKIQGGVGVASADPYIGEIVLFAGNFAPRGWAFCDGQLLQISQNTALFSLLGTTYGGDGRSTFGLPDLRGRVPVHAGTGPGLTERRLGAQGGSETGQCVSEFDNMQPFTTLNYIIALQGLYPSRPLSSLKVQGGVGVASADPYLGEIVLFAGNFAPRGWAFTDGQLLSINDNQALFSLLGTTYGGDGRTTFGLPDLRGRVPVHAGTGPGLTERRLGAQGGSETGQYDGTCPTSVTTPETTSETTDVTSTPETTSETTDVTSTPETTSETTDVTSTPETTCETTVVTSAGTVTVTVTKDAEGGIPGFKSFPALLGLAVVVLLFRKRRT